MPDFKKKRNILHLVLWILSLIAAGLVADLACFKCGEHYCRNQFIDATVYGYLIVGFLLFGAILFDEDIPEKTLYLLTAGGFALYVVAGIILLLIYDDEKDYAKDEFKFRVLSDGAVCLALGILYLFELIASLANKDLLEGSI